MFYGKKFRRYLNDFQIFSKPLFCWLPRFAEGDEAAGRRGEYMHGFGAGDWDCEEFE